MSRSVIRLLITATLAVGGGLIGVWVAKRRFESIDAARTTHILRPATWRYPNEQSWLVGEALGAVAGLAHFARTGAAADPASLDFEVQDQQPREKQRVVFNVRRRDRKEPQFQLTITDHVFSPAAFQPVARGWLGEPAPRGEPSSTLVADRLVDLRMETLQWAHSTVSEEVTRDPRSVAAHEDAALVIVAFALRESAAGHTDPRRLLTRAAAHLAIAAALRGQTPPSPSGRLAEIGILVLVGRQGEAVEKIAKAATPASSGERAWLRALRLFATQDWRELAWNGPLTLVERLAWFRAFKARVGGTDRAYGLLEALPPEQQSLPDWGRIRLTGWPTVRDCHTYAVGGFTADVHEAATASERFRNVRPTDLSEALNAEAPVSPVVLVEGRPRVEVLDWGMVAAFLQRHLGARLSYETYCYEHVFGLPDKTAEAVSVQESMFGRLTLFPLEAHRWVKTSARYKPYADRAARLVTERPELVTPHLWKRLLQDPIFGHSPNVPRATTWFDPPLPFGTTLDNDTRVDQPAGDYEGITQLDPFDTGARWGTAKQRFGARPPYEHMLKAFGPALEWDLTYMPTLADLAEDRPAEKRRWLEKCCSVDADQCHNLASFLADSGDEAGAAQAYRKWWKEGMDRVMVANGVEWLVEYDRTHGRGAEAWQVARDAASTYSAGGLTTLAKLGENTQRLDVAEDNFRKVSDRYDWPDMLYEFYTRQISAGRKRFAPLREALVKEVFPNGFEPLVGTPSEKPSDGAIVWELQEEARAAGFQINDVIVALDRTRIHSRPQWRIAWLHRPSEERRVLVYRGSAYREIAGRFKNTPIPLRALTYPQTR